MQYLRNAWYMAGWAWELDQGPLGRTLLDQPVALFRDGDGVAKAIADRCPHRFVRLSGGRVIDGALECPYHGLRFDGAGGCVHNPQGSPPKQAHTSSFALVERHSILWIWMGDAAPDPAAIPDFSCNDPDTHQVFGDYIAMSCDYRFGTDNILDLSHIQFSHRDSLAPRFAGAATEEGMVRQDGQVVWSMRRYAGVPLQPAMAFAGGPAVGTPVDYWLNVRWHAPSAMLLHSAMAADGDDPTNDSRQGRHTHIFTPETARSSHYWFGVTRDKDRYTADQARAELARLRGPFLEEDAPLLAEQQQAFDGQDFWSARPIVLEGDAAAIRARRILDKLIREEQRWVASVAGPTAGALPSEAAAISA